MPLPVLHVFTGSMISSWSPLWPQQRYFAGTRFALRAASFSATRSLLINSGMFRFWMRWSATLHLQYLLMSLRDRGRGKGEGEEINSLFLGSLDRGSSYQFTDKISEARRNNWCARDIIILINVIDLTDMRYIRSYIYIYIHVYTYTMYVYIYIYLRLIDRILTPSN